MPVEPTGTIGWFSRIAVNLGTFDVPTADALHSELLLRAGFAHAFFTRRGGISAPPFDTLHFGAAGDCLEPIQENYRRAAAVLGVPRSSLYLPTQVHGRAVRQVGAADDPSEVARERADALVTGVPGLACCVRTADCIPVLVADQRSGAVAAVHSGWRGTTANVIQAAIEALRRIVGGDGELVAAVGPHIRRCCFEVGPDVADALAACDGVRAANSILPSSQQGRARVDLSVIVRAQLLRAGVHARWVDDIGGCTVCDADRFFSHRRDKERSGRMLAGVVAREAGPLTSWPDGRPLRSYP